MTISHHLFFALKPPLAQARQIGLIRDRIERPDAIVSNERLHVTLAITRNYPELPAEVAARMTAIGESVAADPFGIAFDRLSGGERSVALRPSRRPPALRALQKQLDDALAYWNLRRAGWSFNPHITLAYWRRQPLLMPIAPIGWEARELVLVHSVVGRTLHIELGRWPLVQRQQSLQLF